MFKFGQTTNKTSALRMPELDHVPGTRELQALLGQARTNWRNSVEQPFRSPESEYARFTIVVKCERDSKSAGWTMYRTDLAGSPTLWFQQSTDMDLLFNLVDLECSKQIQANPGSAPAAAPAAPAAHAPRAESVPQASCSQKQSAPVNPYLARLQESGRYSSEHEKPAEVAPQPQWSDNSTDTTKPSHSFSPAAQAPANHAATPSASASTPQPPAPQQPSSFYASPGEGQTFVSAASPPPPVHPQQPAIQQTAPSAAKPQPPAQPASDFNSSGASFASFSNPMEEQTQAASDFDKMMAETKQKKDLMLKSVITRLQIEGVAAAGQEVLDVVKQIIDPFNTANLDSTMQQICSDLHQMLDQYGDAEVACALVKTFTAMRHGRSVPAETPLENAISKWFW